MRRPLTWIAWLIAGGAALYGAIFVYVVAVSRRDQREPADAIVVLGAAHYNGRPSNVLRARLDHAVELYREGLAALIVVTGGKADGDRLSEAMVSREYLLGRRVPDSAVVMQPTGRNSRESMAAAAEWLGDRGLRDVVLVSDPFHMARLVAEARALDLAPRTSPTRTSPISSERTRELEYLAAETLKLPVVWLQSFTR